MNDRVETSSTSPVVRLILIFLLAWPFGSALGIFAFMALPFMAKAYVEIANTPAPAFAWWEWPWGWPGVRLAEAQFAINGFRPVGDFQQFSWLQPMDIVFRWPLALFFNALIAMLPLYLLGLCLQVGKWAWHKMQR